MEARPCVQWPDGHVGVDDDRVQAETGLAGLAERTRTHEAVHEPHI
jgi:hypothetical protein